MPVSAVRRYWIEFDFPERERSYGYTYLPGLGCGISAFDQEDAFQILREWVLREPGWPAIGRVVEDVDVSALDPRNVLPNIGVPTWRGVWYPAYNMWYGPHRAARSRLANDQTIRTAAEQDAERDVRPGI